jgi:magnesium transporter
MAPEEAQDAKKLLQYDRHTAGGLMITEFLSYQADAKLSSVINDLNDHPEKYHNYDVQYLYVVDSRFRLQGVVPTRRLLFHEGKSTLHEVMISKPHSLKATANLEELSAFFREHDFFGVPIIEDDGKLAGVVQRKDLRAAMQEASDRSFLHLSGILGGEEFRSMPIIQRSFRRGAWLVLNVCLNMLGASVIALNQDTLQAAIALAVFLPMISDMSGCSGNQAVAVSIRELTLGLVKPTEIFRVVIKESKVGFLNGLFLGILLGGLAWLWKSNIYLSLIVGVALMINTILSVCLGGMLPLISKRFKLDPAMVSSPILTTCTDVCGFFLVLGGASLVLDKL